MPSRITQLLAEEHGQAMTQNGLFYGVVAVGAATMYYFAGDRVHRWMSLVATTLPPPYLGQ